MVVLVAVTVMMVVVMLVMVVIVDVPPPVADNLDRFRQKKKQTRKNNIGPKTCVENNPFTKQFKIYYKILSNYFCVCVRPFSTKINELIFHC